VGAVRLGDRGPPELCRPPESPANTSLGLASTELLRLVNAHVKHLPKVDYETTLKEQLALRILSQRRSCEPSLEMDRPPTAPRCSGTS
jgi:hypothetical protein